MSFAVKRTVAVSKPVQEWYVPRLMNDVWMGFANPIPVQANSAPPVRSVLVESVKRIAVAHPTHASMVVFATTINVVMIPVPRSPVQTRSKSVQMDNVSLHHPVSLIKIVRVERYVSNKSVLYQLVKRIQTALKTNFAKKASALLILAKEKAAPQDNFVEMANVRPPALESFVRKINNVSMANARSILVQENNVLLARPARMEPVKKIPASKTLAKELEPVRSIDVLMLPVRV